MIGTTPAARLPVELLSCVARHLSYRDVCAAVNVCHRWRGALLEDTSLWTCIQLSIHSPNYGRWLSVLRTLVGRSPERPLSLELYSDDIVIEPDTAEYRAMERLANYVSAHMGRMKSLNLSIPSCTTDGWTECLQQPAPLLEFLAIDCHTCYEVPRLPVGLFGGHAPRLRGLSLEHTYFPVEFFDHPSPALASVTSLYFYTGGLLQDDDVLVFLDGLPNLRQLTITGVISYDPLEYVYDQTIELRLIAAEGVEQVVAAFPRAESVVYSFSAAHGHGTHEAPGLIEVALSSRAPVTSLDIAWTPGAYNKIFSQRADAPEGYHSVVVNGRPLLVDVHINRLHAALAASEVTNGLARNLRSLALVDSLWPLFTSAEMPALEALTVYLRAPEEDWGADGSVFHHTPAHPQRALRDLRLSRAPSRQICAEYFRIPTSLLVAFIHNTVAPECQPSLYLKGIFAVGDAVEALSGVTARIVFEECSTFVEPDFWRGDIIMEDGVVPAPKEDS